MRIDLLSSNMMAKIRGDFYIEILKYANKKNEFILKELYEDLDMNQEERNLVCGSLVNSKLFFHNTEREKNDQTGNHSLFMISVEGRFKLLEYEELDEAKKSGKQAKTIAIYAIILSAILALLSILIQIFGSVELDGEQYHKILDSLNVYGNRHMICNLK